MSVANKLKGSVYAGACLLGVAFTAVGGIVYANSDEAGPSEKLGGGLLLTWMTSSTALWGRRSYVAFTAPDQSPAGPAPANNS